MKSNASCITGPRRFPEAPGIVGKGSRRVWGEDPKQVLKPQNSEKHRPMSVDNVARILALPLTSCEILLKLPKPPVFSSVKRDNRSYDYVQSKSARHGVWHVVNAS